MRTKITAKVLEIFSSRQGEGLYPGVRQIFIRFAGCNLACLFCDVPAETNYQTRIFGAGGLRDEVERWRRKFGPYHSLSLTGGEPLLQVEFLKEFLPQVKKIKIYLETNGTLPEEFKEISSRIDYVSLDFKLPSSTGRDALWERHRRFLKLAGRKSCFVKAVITGKTTPEDLKKAVGIIAGIDKNIPLILQPVTAVDNFRAPVSGEQLLDFQKYALKKLSEVRIIPQLHKRMGLR